MTLSLSRIRPLLESAGFEVGLQTWSHDWSFVRDDQRPGLFQQAEIGFAGRRREAVHGRVWVSATRHFLVHGLCADRLLVELASDERGHAVLQRRGDAIAWERRFAELAPREAAALATEAGPGILAAAAPARATAERYRARLPRCESPYAQLTELRRRHRDLATTAARLAEWPGVRQLRGTEELYELACLCVLAHVGEVEGCRESFRLVPGGGRRGPGRPGSRPALAARQGALRPCPAHGRWADRSMERDGGLGTQPLAGPLEPQIGQVPVRCAEMMSVSGPCNGGKVETTRDSIGGRPRSGRPAGQATAVVPVVPDSVRSTCFRRRLSR